MSTTTAIVFFNSIDNINKAYSLIVSVYNSAKVLYLLDNTFILKLAALKHSNNILKISIASSYFLANTKLAVSTSTYIRVNAI